MVLCQRNIYPEEKFNLTVEFCSNIEEHTNESIYSEVEEEVKTMNIYLYSLHIRVYFKMVDFNNAISITDNFIPILLAFYIGSWSDKFGRKPFIALFMAGKLVGLLGTLLAGVFLEKLSKWAWLGIVTPINCLAGGVSTFVLITYSFAADNSSER